MRQRTNWIILIVAIAVLFLTAILWFHDSSSKDNLLIVDLPITQVDRGISNEFRNEIQKEINKLEDQKNNASVEPEKIWFELGNLRYQIGDLLGAKLAYEQFLAIEPNHAQALENLGQTFFEMGQVEKAERKFRESLLVEPTEEVYLKMVEMYKSEPGYGDKIKQLLEDAIATLGERESLVESLDEIKSL